MGFFPCTIFFKRYVSPCLQLKSCLRDITTNRIVCSNIWTLYHVTKEGTNLANQQASLWEEFSGMELLCISFSWLLRAPSNSMCRVIWNMPEALDQCIVSNCFILKTLKCFKWVLFLIFMHYLNCHQNKTFLLVCMKKSNFLGHKLNRKQSL